MRFTVTVLGTEVFSISTDKPTEGVSFDHDNTCSQVEMAFETPVGFHGQAIQASNRGGAA